VGEWKTIGHAAPAAFFWAKTERDSRRMSRPIGQLFPLTQVWMARKKPGKFKPEKEVRAIARERVGTVKPVRTIVPKSERKPKYKIDPLREEPEK
jgi:hypothetical protein